MGGLNVTNGDHHEMISYENISYRYINDTRLASITGNGHSYSVNYDALGRAAVRVLDGSTTYFIYDGEKPILEYRNWSGPSAKNVYGKDIDEILMRTEAGVNNGQPFYFQDDHEGSITHLTNASGNVIETYTYDAFGAPSIFNQSAIRIPQSAFGNRFLFTGREYVTSFGIYEYRNRAYHPGLGRFMSEDPKGFDAGDYNLFRYVGNDPLDRTDPMGLIDEGHIEPDQMEAAVAGSQRILQYVGHEIAQAYRQDKAGFIILVATMGRGRAPKMGAKPALGEPYLPGKRFTPAQRRQWIQENANQHGGVIKSETTGESLQPGQQSTKGVRPPDNEVNVHHVIPRSKGGTNSPDNKQIISRKENLQNSNKMPPPGGTYNYLTVSDPSESNSSNNASQTDTATMSATSVEPEGGFARSLGLAMRNPRYFSPALP